MSSTPTPEMFDAATIDLVFALRDSLTDAGPSRLEYWNGRASTAIETAAAGASTWGQAVTIAARKLQIDTLTPEAAQSVTKYQALIDADYEAWAGHVARNIVYIIALASVERDSRKPAKRTTETVQPTLDQKAPF